MSQITPYKINVPDAELAALKAKLSAATFPPEVDFSDDWDYGSPRSDVRRLAKVWETDYDWRAEEATINAELPQFTTPVTVEGFGELKMHFVHQTSTQPGSIPLLFVHGWPGSFLEVRRLLPFLTKPSSGQAFHVVAPSLPNYGFSDGVRKKGFSIPQYAEAVHGVMLNLGYKQYVTQGGDWGMHITRMLALRYPKSCLANHLNFSRLTDPPSFSKNPVLWARHQLSSYSASDQAGIARTDWFMAEGMGYNLEQSTKPSTIGFAFADSPVALLAWIYEKLHDWTDSFPWSDNEALTWVSVYQFSTAGPAASARIYYETRHAERKMNAKALRYIDNGVALGLSVFPRDIVVAPRTWYAALGPMVFERLHSDGGHFAAHERPEQLAGDLREMFGKGGGAYFVSKRLLESHRL